MLRPRRIGCVRNVGRSFGCILREAWMFKRRCSFSEFLGAAVVLTCLAVFQWYIADVTDGMQRAYIGPGAGIALVGSFLTVLVAMISALGVILTWPIRWVRRAIRGRDARRNAKVKRVVILGLDGLAPELVDQFLEEGLLPNFAKLRDDGTYMRLGTTWPPLSPVAWSSFSTGTNPGKHNIFDFINRNTTDYQPMISSVKISHPRSKLRLGRFCIPLKRTRIDGLRKSKPFWNVLSEAGTFSAVLRVPITFPPDKFHGVQLSAMSVPDLRGTQGTFTYFCENGEGGITTEGDIGSDIGGERIVVHRNGGTIDSYLPGPQNPLRCGSPVARLPFRVTGKNNGDAVLHIAGKKIPLKKNQFTDWVCVRFPLAPGVKINGICHFFLKSLEAPFEMYCSPLNLDPGKPAMPISHPHVYSIYLAKLLGPYATLGLAEDTGALSEGLMTEESFLQQAYSIDQERQRMFFDTLHRVRRGMVACVFDASDRIQHMFWAFQDDQHPGHRNAKNNGEAHRHVIRDMYVKMDKLVGRTIAALDKDTALLVMSDHGFKPFRYGVDLNAWLLANGYLYLKEDRSQSDGSYLADVDWSRTKAYAIGLSGIFINQLGRESQGIVAKGEETQELVRQLCRQLTGLRDPRHDNVAIHEAVAREDVYRGPYVDAAPDIIVGYDIGYRVSWGAAVGKCSGEVFSDNTKAWSGDHCVHPKLVPGVLLSNLKLRTDQANIIDLAPTVLELLGVAKPKYMEGKSLLCADATSLN